MVSFQAREAGGWGWSYCHQLSVTSTTQAWLARWAVNLYGVKFYQLMLLRDNDSNRIQKL